MSTVDRANGENEKGLSAKERHPNQWATRRISYRFSTT